MKKEYNKYPFTSGTSRVYEVNDKNNEIINSAKQRMYSSDKKYVLVYDNIDSEKINNFYRFIYWLDYISHRSREDQIYDDFLYELDPLDDTDLFYQYKEVLISEKFSLYGTIRDFKSDKDAIACFFNHQEAVVNGAEAIFGLCSSVPKENQKVLLTVRFNNDLNSDQNQSGENKKSNLKEENINE